MTNSEKQPVIGRRGARSVSTARLLALALLMWPSAALPFATAGDAGPHPGRVAADKARAAAEGGDTMTVYGPRRFDRAGGPPANAVEQFSLPGRAVPPYTVLVQNGSPDGGNRVSSATVKLNGADLLTTRDFNQSVPSVTRAVPLLSDNTIDVKLASSPGSFLIITITAGQAAIESLTPARAKQGQALSVILRGRNTHWAGGQTRVSLGAEVSVGEAAEGEPGPVTVIDATTLVAQVSVHRTAALAPRPARVVTPLAEAGREEIVSLTDALTITAATATGDARATVTTLAGVAGAAGFADGPAEQARFRNPAAVAIGPDDTIYVADAGNNRIRAVSRQTDFTGASVLMVSTLAGDGAAGFIDGPSASARFDNPQGVAIDESGTVYVADTGNHSVRRIAVDGTVTTVAGNGTPGFQDGVGGQARFNSPRAIAIESSGKIYLADAGNSAVRVVTPAGEVRTITGDGSIGSNDSPNARFDGPAGVALDNSRLYVYLADTGNHRIRRLDQNGLVVTLAGRERGFADGPPDQARFAEPAGLSLDGAGRILVADSTNSLVRVLDPQPVTGGATDGITTLAGTGDRGWADGPGDQARFFAPRGIAVSRSSAIVVADTGNSTLRRILLPPAINSFTPPQARPSEAVIITGDHFDGRSNDSNIVRFRAASGQTLAEVTRSTPTELTVIVPPDAITGPVTVQTEGGTAESEISFGVPIAAPAISDFSPKSGPAGTVVTLTGAALKADTGATTVTFQGASGVRRQALVTFVSPDTVRAIVPAGAVTGLIEITNSLGRAVSGEAFTVEAGGQDFQITVAPSSTRVVSGSAATFVVYLVSADPAFNQLAWLSATALPAGASAAFDPPQITAGARATLSVSLANSELLPGNYSFTVRAAAIVDGAPAERTASITLGVVAAGQTTLTGRVLSTDSEPVMGATVSLDGRSATTDAAGAFLLEGVNEGADRPVMVDGRTASAPNRTYPVIIEPATVVRGQANLVPFTFYLPPIDTEFEVEVVPGRDSVCWNPRVPGLRMTIPAGANLRNRDGSPVARVSITPLAPDRTPAPLPASVRSALVYTSQPGGALTSIAIPVIYPNLTGADPNARLELYAFDHDTVRWYVYGYGRVSRDGRAIEPEIDPQTGRPYGLRDFSWHFPSVAPDGDPAPRDTCPANRTENMVDLATGAKIESAIDIAFGGARGAVGLARTHTSELGGRGIIGRFGRGTKDNYDIRLAGSFEQGGAGRVVFAEQVTGRLFSFARTEADGSLVFTTTRALAELGDTVRKLANGTFEYRYRDGGVLRFDGEGRLTSMLDRNGNATALVYSGSNLIRIIDPVGRAITLEYDERNHITKAVDALGRAWRYSYDSQNRLSEVTDPAGNTTGYSYDFLSRLSSIKDKRGNLAKQIGYGSDGRVEEQRFADGGVERYRYGLTGQGVSTVTIIDSLGRVEVKRFNARGYVIAHRDGLGQESFIERQIATDLPLSTTGPCGCREAERRFDERGNIVETRDRLGQTESYEYEPDFNNLTRIIDKLGRVTGYEYDSRGNLTAIVNALNQTITFGYGSFGQMTELTDPLGHTSRLEYDSHGNVTAAVDASGNRTVMEYDEIGRRTAIIDPLGRRTGITYDRLDRITSVTDEAGAVTSFEYDANGNRTGVTNTLGQRRAFSYDAKNRPVSLTDPLGRVAAIDYNTDDEIIRLVSAQGRVTRYEYDLRGQQTAIISPPGQALRFTYDSRRNLTAFKDERGNTTSFSYDELFRRVATRDPLGGISFIVYDAAGNVTETVDRLGRRTTISYDELDRPTRFAYADSAVNYSYDNASRLTRIDDSLSGSILWSYDDADRVVSETAPAGATVYTYNAAGQRTSMTAADRPPIFYGYDSAGRLKTIAQGAEVFSYGYDSLSRRVALVRPNGVRTSYSYDVAGRLARLLHANGQDQILEEYQYAYSADDEIIAITSLHSSAIVPEARSIGVADAANRITQSGASSFSFNAAGETLSNSTGQGAARHRWDARGRLAGVTLPDGQEVTYAYDGLGRRASRTAGGVTTSFLYDGADVVLDKASDGTAVDYLNGGGVDEKLRQGKGRYFLQDHLSSTAALVDESGSVVERIGYEPFGASSGGAATRYGYTGREKDAATGLMYYRARWYDPQQGRFLSEDPIGLAGGTNLYRYAHNDPINFSDPFGLYERDVHLYLTYFLASLIPCLKDALGGPTQSPAWKIAKADQGTDEDALTSPGLGVWARQRGANRDYHALHPDTHNRYLRGFWEKAMNSPNNIDYVWLGRYLHYLQDTYSHEGYTNGFYGHLFAGHSNDKTHNDPSKARAMVNATWEALKKFAKAKCHCDKGRDDIGDDDWERIERFIRQTGGPSWREISSGELGAKWNILFR